MGSNSNSIKKLNLTFHKDSYMLLIINYQVTEHSKKKINSKI